MKESNRLIPDANKFSIERFMQYPYNWDEFTARALRTSKTDFKKYIEDNTNSLAQKIEIAKLSQKKVQGSGDLGSYSIYDMLNTKSKAIVGKMASFFGESCAKTDLTKQEYIRLMVEKLGFIILHFYILAILNEASFNNNHTRRISIVDFILELVKNNLNDNNLQELILEKLNKLKIPKGVYSTEFYDLIFALAELPSDQLIEHYKIYSDWQNKIEKFSAKSFLDFYNNFRTINNKIHLKARDGIIYAIDIVKSIKHLGVDHGSRIETIDGFGTVVGMDAHDRLWVQLDKNSSIDCYKNITTADDLKKYLLLSTTNESLAPISLKNMQDLINENNIQSVQVHIDFDDRVELCTISIAENELKRHNCQTLDRLNDKDNGKGTVLGIYGHRLYVLSDKYSNEYLNNHRDRHYDSDLDLVKFDSTDDEINDIYKAPLIEFAYNLRKQLLANKFPVVNYKIVADHKHNIFIDFRLYFVNKLQKSNENEKDYKKRIVIFNAITDYTEYFVAQNNDNLFTEILKNNINTIKIPKGFSSKKFYSLVDELLAMPAAEVLVNFKEYKELLNGNNNLLSYISECNQNLNEQTINYLKNVIYKNINSILLLFQTTKEHDYQIINISNDRLIEYNIQFLDKVVTNLGVGFVLGLNENKLVIHMLSENSTSELNLKSYQLPTDEEKFELKKIDLNLDADKEHLIDFLNKLKQSLSKSIIPACDENLKFDLSLINDNNNHKRYSFKGLFNKSEQPYQGPHFGENKESKEEFEPHKL